MNEHQRFKEFIHGKKLTYVEMAQRLEVRELTVYRYTVNRVPIRTVRNRIERKFGFIWRIK